jgi:polar amino acid transport system substrate-binding protein
MPLYKEQWYAFKRKNSNITIDKDFSNINKIKLGISRGFLYGGKIQRLIDEKKFKSIEKVHNNELNINKLIVGRFDIFLGVKSAIFFLSKSLGLKDKIEIVKQTNTNIDFLLNSSNTYLAFSKKNIDKIVVEKFSNVLKQMKKDGTIDFITNKYY